MSLLRRTGNNRNNIDWYNASSNSSGKYFKRTGTSRNNVQWINISSNGTHNLLNRTSTGRNNISWKNTTFSFKTEEEIMYEDVFFKPLLDNDCKLRVKRTPYNSDGSGRTARCDLIYNSNGYYSLSIISETNGTIHSGGLGGFYIICSTSDIAENISNHFNQYLRKSDYYIKTRYKIQDTSQHEAYITKTGKLYYYRAYLSNTVVQMIISEKVSSTTSKLTIDQDTLFYYK